MYGSHTWTATRLRCISGVFNLRKSILLPDNPHTAVVIAQDVMVGKELDRPWQDAVKKVLGADFLHLLGRQHFGFTFEHSFPPSAVFADSGRG